MKILSFFLFLMMMVSSVQAQKIENLIPGLLIPLKVEPAIPEDFVAAAPMGKPDPYDWIYWGPHDVLEQYFKNEDSLKIPLIRVKLSANTCQKGEDEFLGYDDNTLKQLKMMDPTSSYVKGKWGKYPVHTVNASIGNQRVIMAFVGLNDPEAGWTLMFNLVYPKSHGAPSEHDMAFWNNFIANSKPLR